MLSAIVVLTLAFVALGLLLGYAATYDVDSGYKPSSQIENSVDGANIIIEESVQITVERSRTD